MHRAARLHRRWIEVEQRERLPDQHLARGQVATGEPFAARSEIEIPVDRLHEFTAITAIVRLEDRLRRTQQGELAGVVRGDVPALAQRHVDDREQLVGDDRLERCIEWYRHRDSLGASVQSSISISEGTVRHVRSRASQITRALPATNAAIAPTAL